MPDFLSVLTVTGVSWSRQSITLEDVRRQLLVGEFLFRFADI